MIIFVDMLSQDDFYKVGELSHFVSIDVIVRYKNKYLFGLRNNNPAKDTLFVPGSKVFKNNSLKEEIPRITDFEIGIKIRSNDIKFIGVFDHIYDRNFRNKNHTTHYNVNCILYVCKDTNDFKKINKYMENDDQHKKAYWLSKDEILKNNKVHQFCKYYFSKNAPNVLYRTEVL